MTARLPRKELVRLSKMTLDELYDEVGLAVRPDMLVKSKAPGRAPEFEAVLTFHPFMMTPIRIRLPKKKIRRAVKSLISNFRPRLYRKICMDWHYCDKRTQYGNEEKLSYAIAGLIAAIIKDIPVAATYAIAFILIKMGLDKFCKCGTLAAGKKT